MDQLLRFICLFLLLATFGGASQAQVFVNYEDQIAIDEKGDWRFVPEIATLRIDGNEFALADLAFTLPADAAVFFGDVMWLHTAVDTSFAVPLAAIKREFPTPDGILNLIIYKKGIQKGDVVVRKGLFKSANQAALVTAYEDADIISRRLQSPVAHFFYLVFLTIFCLIALFKLVYPSVLTFIVHPMLIFSTEDFSDSGSSAKFFTEEIMFFLVIFNMLLMGLIIISAFFLNVPILEQLITGDLNQLFLVWLLGTGILLVISLLKFLWLRISALIFGISKIEFVHFFYMLRVASIILISMYIILIVCFSNNIPSLMELLSYLLKGFLALYILGLIMLFFMMVANVPLKNYHLFSYLCTAELVPFLVLSKLIIG